MRIVFVAFIALTALATACADEGDDGAVATPQEGDVLQLRGFDISAGNFRHGVRTLFIDRDPTFCRSIEGFTPAEALEALDVALGVRPPAGLPMPNATPVTEQARRSREDEERAAQITLDECRAAGDETTESTGTPGA